MRGQLVDALPWFVVPVLVAVLLRLTVVGAFVIPSSSMEDTLPVGDRVLTVNRVFTPERGDIVVFRDPGSWLADHGDLIKRVIAVGGDTVACAGPGEPVTVNGRPLDEPYIKRGANPSESAFSQTVPEGFLWVMGDNRPVSADSRVNGLVPVSSVVGVAKLVYWPVTEWKVL